MGILNINNNGAFCTILKSFSQKNAKHQIYHSVKKHTSKTLPPPEPIVGRLNDVAPVQLEIVVERNRVKLWNECIG